MKSIVFLSHLQDEGERGGAYLRNSALSNCFVSWGMEVRTFYRGQFSLKPQKLKKFLMGLRFGREIRSLFTKATFHVPACDILLIDTIKYFSWTFSYDGPKPLVIYNAHNLEFENHFGKISSKRKSKFAKYEVGLFDKVDLILVCSPREKELILSYNRALESKIFIFPNLVSANRFSLKSSSKRTLFSFIGTLDYFPNIEAVKFLAKSIYPELPQNLKDSFLIAGRRPSEEVRLLCKEVGIEMRLDLSESEMAELYLNTKILLVPLAHGSGTRLKIIEGVLAGCMILSTPIGREGIDSKRISEASLDSFLEEFLVLSSLESNPSVENDFLENYELESWAKKNKSNFLSFIESETQA